MFKTAIAKWVVSSYIRKLFISAITALAISGAFAFSFMTFAPIDLMAMVAICAVSVAFFIIVAIVVDFFSSPQWYAVKR